MLRGAFNMRPYNLNDEEIAHTNDMRGLTTQQRDVIYYLTRLYIRGPSLRPPRSSKVVSLFTARAAESKSPTSKRPR